MQDSGGVENGPSLSWLTREIHFALHAAGTGDIDGDLERAELRAAFTAWEGVEHCSPPELGIPSARTDLRFVEDPPSATDRIGPDYEHPEESENLLIFRDGGWPMPGQTDVIALTTVHYNALTGEIIDADIEFNSADFHFVADGSRAGMDLRNTATHEIGHLLGLDHTKVAGATMLASADVGETEKRSLECDDRDGVVFKYPEGEPNGYCEPTVECGYCAPPDTLSRYPVIDLESRSDGIDDGCGCGAAEAPGAVALLLGLAALARRRRASA